MTLTSVLATFRRRWRVATAGLLLAVLAGVAYLATATPLYRSTAAFFVSSMGDTESDSAYTDNLFSQGRVNSYLQVLGGQQLAAGVVDELDLPMTPAELTSRVEASVSPQTVVLQLAVTDPSPERAQQITTALGEAFAARIEQLETPAGADWSPVQVTVIEDPTLPTSPVSPDPALVLAAALGLGLLLGLAAAVLRERLDDTVQGEGDVSAALGAAAVLGTVPRWEATGGLLGADQAGSLASEAYRTVRTNLQFVDVDAPPRVIVVTSSLSGEGKTTTSVQLAAVLAQAGKRVLLVDGDLRRPRVAAELGLVGDVGLSSVLAGSATLGEALQYSTEPGLTVIAAGPTAPYPSELLGSRQMAALLVRLREEYDHVVIDAPPVLPVTDAAVLGVQADGVVLVGRHGQTRRAELRQAGAALALVEARLLGVVLNAVPPRTMAGRYGYASYPETSAVPVVAPPVEAAAVEVVDAPPASRVSLAARGGALRAAVVEAVSGRHRAPDDEATDDGATEDEAPVLVTAGRVATPRPDRSTALDPGRKRKRKGAPTRPRAAAGSGGG